MMASQKPEITGALLDPLEKTTTLTDWPSTTSEQQQSDYKPHVRCWVYRTVPAHGDRFPFSTGTPWRSQRPSFFSSDRKRTTSTVNGYKNKTTAATTTDNMTGGQVETKHDRNRWVTIYGRWRRQNVISNITFSKQRTGVR